MLVRADFMAIEWSGWPDSCLLHESAAAPAYTSTTALRRYSKTARRPALKRDSNPHPLVRRSGHIVQDRPLRSVPSAVTARCLNRPLPGQQRLLTCICDRYRLSRPTGLLPPSDQGSPDDQPALREVDYLTRVNQAAIFVGGVE
jgi:hypothetical protein